MQKAFPGHSGRTAYLLLQASLTFAPPTGSHAMNAGDGRGGADA